LQHHDPSVGQTEKQEHNMDNSLEQRFVDRLLHALAAMGDYEPAPKAAESAPAQNQASETPLLPH
jgi:hypothetical protein